MTKAREASINTSKLARNHLYDQSKIDSNSVQNRGSVTDALTIGDATRDQFDYGVFEPSTQAAIDQLTHAMMPVGSILTTTSIVTPGGVAFIEDLTITGTSNGEYVIIYGIQVPVDIGDSNVVIAGKVTSFLAASDLFRSVTDQGNGVVRFTHRDNMRHDPYSWDGNDITVTGAVFQQSNEENTVNYGSWTLLGQEVKFTETFYYWKRES